MNNNQNYNNIDETTKNTLKILQKRLLAHHRFGVFFGLGVKGTFN